MANVIRVTPDRRGEVHVQLRMDAPVRDQSLLLAHPDDVFRSHESVRHVEQIDHLLSILLCTESCCMNRLVLLLPLLGDCVKGLANSVPVSHVKYSNVHRP